jgi:hypothetical protein
MTELDRNRNYGEWQLSAKSGHSDYSGNPTYPALLPYDNIRAVVCGAP